MGLIYFLRNMRHRENRNAVPFDVTYNGQTMDLLSPLKFFQRGLSHLEPQTWVWSIERTSVQHLCHGVTR